MSPLAFFITKYLGQDKKKEIRNLLIMILLSCSCVLHGDGARGMANSVIDFLKVLCNAFSVQVRPVQVASSLPATIFFLL